MYNNYELVHILKRMSATTPILQVGNGTTELEVKYLNYRITKKPFTFTEGGYLFCVFLYANHAIKANAAVRSKYSTSNKVIWSFPLSRVRPNTAHNLLDHYSLYA